jgi:hypothetical protein
VRDVERNLSRVCVCVCVCTDAEDLLLAILNENNRQEAVVYAFDFKTCANIVLRKCVGTALAALPRAFVFLFASPPTADLGGTALFRVVGLFLRLRSLFNEYLFMRSFFSGARMFFLTPSLVFGVDLPREAGNLLHLDHRRILHLHNVMHHRYPCCITSSRPAPSPPRPGIYTLDLVLRIDAHPASKTAATITVTSATVAPAASGAARHVLADTTQLPYAMQELVAPPFCRLGWRERLNTRIFHEKLARNKRRLKFCCLLLTGARRLTILTLTSRSLDETMTMATPVLLLLSECVMIAMPSLSSAALARSAASVVRQDPSLACVTMRRPSRSSSLLMAVAEAASTAAATAAP